MWEVSSSSSSLIHKQNVIYLDRELGHIHIHTRKFPANYKFSVHLKDDMIDILWWGFFIQMPFNIEVKIVRNMFYVCNSQRVLINQNEFEINNSNRRQYNVFCQRQQQEEQQGKELIRFNSSHCSNLTNIENDFIYLTEIQSLAHLKLNNNINNIELEYGFHFMEQKSILLPSSSSSYIQISKMQLFSSPEKATKKIAKCMIVCHHHDANEHIEAFHTCRENDFLTTYYHETKTDLDYLNIIQERDSWILWFHIGTSKPSFKREKLFDGKTMNVIEQYLYHNNNSEECETIVFLTPNQFAHLQSLYIEIEKETPWNIIISIDDVKEHSHFLEQCKWYLQFVPSSTTNTISIKNMKINICKLDLFALFSSFSSSNDIKSIATTFSPISIQILISVSNIKQLWSCLCGEMSRFLYQQSFVHWDLNIIIMMSSMRDNNNLERVHSWVHSRNHFQKHKIRLFNNDENDDSDMIVRKLVTQSYFSFLLSIPFGVQNKNYSYLMDLIIAKVCPTTDNNHQNNRLLISYNELKKSYLI
jgi:hypothetical protein